VEFNKPLLKVADKVDLSTQPSSKMEAQHVIRLQKRFNESPEAQHSKAFVMRQIALRRKKQDKILQKQQHMKRMHQLHIFRQYRQGDSSTTYYYRYYLYY